MNIQFAAMQKTVYEAAVSYSVLGLSVVPVLGKVCVVPWTQYTQQRADIEQIKLWYSAGDLRGVAIVCGAVSGNLVVIDLDGMEAVMDFQHSFPHLTNTFSVRTGSGEGRHYYYRTHQPHKTTIAPGYELRSDGGYVVAPPSRHPVSKRKYQVQTAFPVMDLFDLNNVQEWIISKRPPPTVTPPPAPTAPKPPMSRVPLSQRQRLNRYSDAAIERQLLDLRRTHQGVNNKLNAVTYTLARLAANPDFGLSEVELKAQIADAARHLTMRDGIGATMRTIESAWNAGIQKPAPTPRMS